MDMDTKLCSKCKIKKPKETDFYKASGYRDGYKSYCKECQHSFKSQTPQSTLDRVYRMRLRNRQFIYDYYLANPCIDCGETDPVVLELDHLDKTQKVAGVSQLVHNTRSLETIKREIAKCEVVCANCHRRRTARTQGWYGGITIGEESST